MSAATPGQALSPDPADFAYHVRATAFNVLTGKMAGDEWSVPRSERDAIARAVVDAVEPLIRADERAVAAQEPHAAPGDDEMARALAVVATERNQLRIALERIADGSRNRDGMMGCASRALTEAARSEPQPAPELADATAKSDRLEGQLEDVRAVVAEMLAAFSPSGSGHTARVGMVQIAKWRTRAGLTS